MSAAKPAPFPLPFQPARAMFRALGSGIVAREFRVCAPATLGIPAIAFALLIATRMAVGATAFTPATLAALFFAQTGLMALLAGVLSGAEEEENGTAEFAARLPLEPGDAFVRKLAGSLLALAVGVAAEAAVFALLVASLAGAGEGAHAKFIGAAIADERFTRSWLLFCVLAYSAALGIGAWVRRVIPTVMASVTAVLALAVFLINRPANESLAISLPLAPIPFFILAAWARHQFRSSPSTLPKLRRRGKRATRARAFSGGMVGKDFHARRLVLGIASAAMIVPMAAGALSPRAMEAAEAEAWPIFAYCVAALLIGADAFTPEERDVTRGLIYMLPISRARLVWAKLQSLAMGFGAITAALWLGAGVGLLFDASDDVAQAAVCLSVFAPVGMLLAAIQCVHFRAPMPAAVIALLASCSLAGLLSAAVGEPALSAFEGRLMAWLGLAVRSLGLAAALAAWLFWLFCRTSIQEARPGWRGLLGILFAAAFVEIAGIVLLCDWRDLAFMVFGF